jgi:hypothetical protein
MAYKVTLTYIVEADSEEVLERYVDSLAYDIAERESFFLDNREIQRIGVPLPGSYRTLHDGELRPTG